MREFMVIWRKGKLPGSKRQTVKYMTESGNWTENARQMWRGSRAIAEEYVSRYPTMRLEIRPAPGAGEAGT